MSETAFSERRALHQHDNLQHTRLPLYTLLAIEFVNRWPMRRFDPTDRATVQRIDLRRALCSIESGYCLDAPELMPAGSIAFDAELDDIGCNVPAMQTLVGRE